jgi:hypothetical protein
VRGILHTIAESADGDLCGFHRVQNAFEPVGPVPV